MQMAFKVEKGNELRRDESPIYLHSHSSVMYPSIPFSIFCIHSSFSLSFPSVCDL